MPQFQYKVKRPSEGITVGIVGVERTEHQVPCQAGTNRHLGGFVVANFAHHHDDRAYR